MLTTPAIAYTVDQTECLHHRVLPIMMLLKHVLDCLVDLSHIPLGFLDRCRPVSFPLPPVDVVLELGELPLLLLDVLAEFAVILLLVGTVYQLQPARLPGSILLRTLLTEVAPSPIPTHPACLFEIAHRSPFGRVVGLE